MFLDYPNTIANVVNMSVKIEKCKDYLEDFK